MLEIPLLIKIASSPISIFLFLVICIVCSHFWFIRYRPIFNEIYWKKVDYFWLAFSVVGLIGLTSQVRQDWYQTELEISDLRVKSSLESLKHRAKYAVSPAICRVFIETDFSPDNLKDIQAEYDFACEEFKVLTKEILSATHERDTGFLDLYYTKQKSLKFSNELITETLNYLLSAYQEYLLTIDERKQIRQKTKKTDMEFILLLLSPYLLVIALTIRVTKVSAEIQIKKTK